MLTLEEQKARVRSGLMYKDTTDELVAERTHALKLANAYNASYGQPPEIREALLAKLLGKIGNGVFFEPTFRCEFGYNIAIGDNFYANFDCVMLDGGGIEIGDNVLFGPRVSIYTTRHSHNPQERAAGACYSKKVKIGDNVWVGGGVHMDCGITIGKNTIVGAGSVITHDIPANVVAAGVPCQVIRKLDEKISSDYFQILKALYSG